MASSDILKSRVRPVVAVEDISPAIRDVAFEGKILSRYGNWDVSKDNPKHPYLHCDLIDRVGYTTITVSLTNPNIEQHEEKLQVGSFIRIENFGIVNKSEKSFEKGDMHFVLKVLSTTSIHVIDVVDNEFIPKFYHSDTIKEFRKRSHEQWATATIVACVIGIRRRYGKYEQLLIADGEAENDNDVIALSHHFNKEYTQIVKAFNNGQCVMVLFKNVGVTQEGDRYLLTNASTIVSTVVDDFTRSQLVETHNKLCKSAPTSTREVYGTMTVTSPTVAPYKQVCSKCKLSNLILLDGGYYCNVCHTQEVVEKKAHVRAKISTVSFQNVSIYVEGLWLQSLVRMTEEQFLSLARGQQIKILSSIRVKGTFSLTPMSFLNGFEEDLDRDMDVNVDSSALANSSLQDGGTPSQSKKRKCDSDSVGASLGTTSSTKSRKM